MIQVKRSRILSQSCVLWFSCLEPGVGPTQAEAGIFSLFFFSHRVSCLETQARDA